ncbi:MAG: hypothetical protein ACI9T7_000571 [Oleiphilaceae bacterium]
MIFIILIGHISKLVIAKNKPWFLHSMEQKHYLSLGSQTPSYELKSIPLKLKKTVSKEQQAVWYFEDSRLNIGNNRVERAMKLFMVGR